MKKSEFRKFLERVIFEGVEDKDWFNEFNGNIEGVLTKDDLDYIIKTVNHTINPLPNLTWEPEDDK